MFRTGFVGFGLGNGKLFILFHSGLNADANDAGHVYYRASNDSDTLDRASNAVSGPAFNATSVVIVTWHMMTYKGGSDATAVSSLLSSFLPYTKHVCYASISHCGDIAANFFQRRQHGERQAELSPFNACEYKCHHKRW